MINKIRSILPQIIITIILLISLCLSAFVVLSLNNIDNSIDELHREIDSITSGDEQDNKSEDEITEEETTDSKSEETDENYQQSAKYIREKEIAQEILSNLSFNEDMVELVITSEFVNTYKFTKLNHEFFFLTQTGGTDYCIANKDQESYTTLFDVNFLGSQETLTAIKCNQQDDSYDIFYIEKELETPTGGFVHIYGRFYSEDDFGLVIEALESFTIEDS